ncbi:MAG TPA: peptidylprolyl isomerase [Caulobacteraceae bacterium]|jgi:peptidyl-prolyl cis-trans isomerase SurA|nr:peptidylprolyl isomerase [Caulobacteraceae bacterium]
MGTRRAAALAVGVISVFGLGAPGFARAEDAPAAPAVTPASAKPPILTAGVAAVVNDEIISTYDLGQRVRLLLVTTGVRPTAQNMPQIEQEALASLVDEHLEIQEIRKQEKDQKFNIVASDEEVNDDLNHIAQGNNTTSDKLLKALASAGVGAQTLKEQIRAQLSWAHWIQGRYGGSRMKVGEDQVNEVMRQVEVQAEQPQYEIAEIFIDAGRAGGEDAAMTGAAQLVAQLQQGAPFSAVARQFSSASTAANGGDAGWLTTSELRPELRPVIDQLRPGQLSQPIPIQNGVYIIYLRAKRSGAGEQMVSLKQAAISLGADASTAAVEAAQRKLMTLKAKIDGCDTMEQQAAKIDGVVAGDLGEANLKDLRPSFREAAEKLSINQVSDPIRTEAGLHLIAVCAKRRSGASIPTRAEIEGRLEDQQLSLIEKRQLRDLKNSATIETR